MSDERDDKIISRLKAAYTAAGKGSEPEFIAKDMECLVMIPFSRARELAFNRDSGDETEREHLSRCLRCSLRVQNFEQILHPSNLRLFQYTIAAVSSSESASILAHLSKPCHACEALVDSLPMNLLRRSYEAGEIIFEGVRHILEAFPTLTHQIAVTSGINFAGHDNIDEKVNAFAENGAFSFRFTQKQTQLEIAVVIADSDTPYRSVWFQVFANGQSIDGEIGLVQSDDYWVGSTDVREFGRLLAPGVEIVAAAFPTNSRISSEKDET